MKRPEMDLTSFIANGHYTTISETSIFWTGSDEPASGPVTLFLHGIPTWSWLWREIVPLVSTVASAIALDLPGFGCSDIRRDRSFAVVDLANSVESFIDSEIGADKPVSLIVHDFGALVGAELISRNPARYRDLVVLNTSLRAQPWTGGGLLSVLSIPVLGQLSMYLAQPWMLRAAMTPFVLNPERRGGPAFEGYWYPFKRGFGQNLASLFQQRVARPDDFQHWREALHRFEGRTLVLWGRQDPTFTRREFEDTLELLPDAEWLIFDRASHFLTEDQPFAVARRIRSFLAGIAV